MSEIIVLQKDELKELIENTARLAGAEGARLAISQQKPFLNERISEDEAIALIGCKKRKLVQLRDERLIEYYTGTKPFQYNRKSILDYIESTKIKCIKAS